MNHETSVQVSYNFNPGLFSHNLEIIRKDPIKVLIFKNFLNPEVIEYWEEAISKNHLLLWELPKEHRTINMYCSVIDQFGSRYHQLLSAIRYDFKNNIIPEKICTRAVKKCIRHLGQLTNIEQTKNVCLTAIYKNPNAIRYINYFNCDLIIEALTKAINDCKEKFDKVCKIICNKFSETQLIEVINKFTHKINEKYLNHYQNALEFQRKKYQKKESTFSFKKINKKINRIEGRVGTIIHEVRMNRKEIIEEIERIKKENEEIKGMIYTLQNGQIQVMNLIGNLTESVEKNNQQIYDLLINQTKSFEIKNFGNVHHLPKV